MTKSPSAIEMREVVKTFGARSVLSRFSLHVRTGEKLALIGPSGSGKSTALRILMTLEGIQGGDVKLFGKSLWRSTPNGAVQAQGAELRRLRQQVGMVFQQFNLFPHMTVLRNVTEAPIKVLGLRRDDAVGRARELLAMVGLTDKEDAYPAFLSGGQQQRVAIARALAMRPRIILFDEVTSALDPELVGEVLNVIRMLAREHDLTILLVTHQMGFAREFADRICFLEGGQIIEEGPPEQILTAPSNPRTQTFLKAVLDA